MIKVYDNFCELSDEECKQAFDSFPERLKEKVRKKCGNEMKKLCIAEYCALQNLLRIENLEDLKFSETGKPYIENRGFFSLSNDKGRFCIAVSDVPVGVDMQRIIPFKQSLADRICNKNELALLDGATDKDLEITKLWTQKEALIKCRGEAIGQNLKTLLCDVKGYKFQFLKMGDFVVCECKKTL